MTKLDNPVLAGFEGTREGVGTLGAPEEGRRSTEQFVNQPL